MNVFVSNLLLSLSLACSCLLSADETRDHWKGSEYAKNSESQKASAEDFMQHVQFKGTESILDVGCGDGKITATMAKKVPSGSVIGVDISSSMIQAAQHAFSNQVNLSFCVQDASKISYDQQFDLITSFTVMQWVLEQQAALRCFEKALKPGGKLWIQMPTGLPKTMEHALEKTISSQRWKSYFTDFSPPWKFYQSDEYQALLSDADLVLTRLEIATKHEQFPSRTLFHGFLKQWFPYLRPIPADQKDAFLTDLLDAYLTILPPDEQGKVSFIVDRLEIEALKTAAITDALYQEPKQEMNSAFFREMITKSADSGETFCSIIDFFQRNKDDVYQFQFKYPLHDKKQAEVFAKVLEIKGQEAHRFVPVFEDCQFVRSTHLGYERKAQVANGPILLERALVDKPSRSVLFLEEQEILPNGEIIEGGFAALNSVVEEEGRWYFTGTYLYNESATPAQAEAREKMFRKTYENMLSFIESGDVDVVYGQLQRY